MRLGRLLAVSGLVAGGVLAALLLLVTLEIALRVADVGADTPRRDPFAGFSSVVPMFTATTNPDGTRVYRLTPARRIGAARAKPEPAREFPVEKRAGAFRIFVVGGSSAAGVPYGTAYAFGGWLERRLAAEAPTVHWEIVNAAMSGYASRRALSVVKELAAYDPDMLIVYSGHNEFAERRFYEHLLDMDPRLFRFWELLAGTRLYALLSRLGVASDGTDNGIPRFDPADLQRSVQMFGVLGRRTSGEGYPTAREIAYGEMLYRFNLETMVRTMRAAGAQVLLLTLSQNFADWPPGASDHRAELSPDERAEWDNFVRNGIDRAREGGCGEARAAFRHALAIDDTHAMLHYRLARCEQELEEFERAFDHYRQASDRDRVPLGAPTRFNEIIRNVARAEGATLVDIADALTRAGSRRLVGDDLFVDFVHPNLRAHQLIARAVARVMRQEGIGVATSQWKADAYADPSPDTLLRDDPDLETKTHLVRAVACLLAQRTSCALEESEAVLAADPANVAARRLVEQLAQTDAEQEN